LVAHTLINWNDQRRLAWLLCKDDKQIHETFHIFIENKFMVITRIRDRGGSKKGEAMQLCRVGPDV